MIRTIYDDDHRKLNKQVLDLFLDIVLNLLEEKSQIILGIAGGRSVAGLFELLRNKHSLIPWGNINIFMIDERIVPLENKHSNFKQARETFIDELIEKGIIKKSNIHPFVMDPDVDDFGGSKYCEELKRFGGKYDIVILGAGEDGHVAALFPDHHSLSDNSEHFVIMNDSPKIPDRRITVSRRLLLKAKAVFIYFLGENKKAAYNSFLDNKVDLNNCPAKLASKIDTAYVITDISFPS